jgi:hypothetical protein
MVATPTSLLPFGVQLVAEPGDPPETAEIQVLRGGAAAVWRARLGGEDVLVKRVAPTTPWTDPGSTFFGGQGLAPPFRPLPLHEAAAWSRLDPARVVDAGTTIWGTHVALRVQPGRPPTAADDPVALTVGLLAAVARLHAADVLHRDIRPANILVHQGTVALVDLDVARVAGLGPVGPLGSRGTRAPETFGAEAGAAADLFAVGATLRHLYGERVPNDIGALIAVLTAPDPADRPRSAQEALGGLGVVAPAPHLSPPHAFALAWWTVPWADTLVGEPWALVRRADHAGLGTPGLAAVASRLLRVAPRQGREAWLALGALCAALYTATRDTRYAAQADEARRRAAAPWHRASRALDALLPDRSDPNRGSAFSDPPPTPADHAERHVTPQGPEGSALAAARQTSAANLLDRTEALCRLGLPRRALEEAVSEQAPSRVARAAWAIGLESRLNAALQAPGADTRSLAVAASRLLLEAPDRVDPAFAALALRDDVLEAVRRLLHLRRFAAAEALAAALPGPPEAWVLVHLVVGRLDPARAAARACARADTWSPVVAGLVAGDPGAEGALRDAALEILRGRVLHTPDAAELAEALGALGQAPTDPWAWQRVAVACAAARRPDLLAGAVARAPAAAGAAPWRVLLGVLLTDPEGATHAESVWQTAIHRFPDDVLLRAVGAAVALARGDVAEARARMASVVERAPGADRAWLFLALLSTNRPSAARAVEGARALGAPRGLVWMVRELVYGAPPAEPEPGPPGPERPSGAHPPGGGTPPAEVSAAPDPRATTPDPVER